jgi:hypothetical protein
MTLCCGRLPPGTRGVARELLDRAAEIASHPGAPECPRCWGLFGERGLFPSDGLVVLPTVCALAQDEGDQLGR